MNELSVSVTEGQLTVTGNEAREVDDELADSGLDLERLCQVAADVLADEGVTTGRLDLHLIDPDAMAELNFEHLGQNGPTDVLSFPLDDDEDELVGLGSDPSSPGGPPVALTGSAQLGTLLLGDVVLCPAVAEDQAAGHVGTVDGELLLLVIHGVLHVLGHDHADPGEARVMQDRERRHLIRLGFEHPVSA